MGPDGAGYATDFRLRERLATGAAVSEGTPLTGIRLVATAAAIAASIFLPTPSSSGSSLSVHAGGGCGGSGRGGGGGGGGEGGGGESPPLGTDARVSPDARPDVQLDVPPPETGSLRRRRSESVLRMTPCWAWRCHRRPRRCCPIHGQIKHASSLFENGASDMAATTCTAGRSGPRACPPPRRGEGLPASTRARPRRDW